MNALKLARLTKGYRQDEFAEVMNVSRTTISNWETNTSIPSVSQIMQIHYKLDISLDDLMEHFNKDKEEN